MRQRLYKDIPPVYSAAEIKPRKECAPWPIRKIERLKELRRKRKRREERLKLRIREAKNAKS